MLYIVTHSPKKAHRDYLNFYVSVVEAASQKEALIKTHDASWPGSYLRPTAVPCTPGLKFSL